MWTIWNCFSNAVFEWDCFVSLNACLSFWMSPLFPPPHLGSKRRGGEVLMFVPYFILQYCHRDTGGGPVCVPSSLGHQDVCGGQDGACLPWLVSHYGCGWRTSVCVPSSLAIRMCGGQDDACLPCLVSHYIDCIVPQYCHQVVDGGPVCVYHPPWLSRCVEDKIELASLALRLIMCTAQ